MTGLISQRRFPHGRAVALYAPADSADGVLFSDDFNRADSATTLGTAYTVAGDLTFGISGNKAYTVDVESSLAGQATHDVGEADIDYTCDIVLRPGGGTDRGAATVRSDGTESNRWVIFTDSAFTMLRLTKYVSGVPTDVETAAFIPVPGTIYTVRVAAKGSSWTVYVDGVSTITATDAANASLTHCGILATRTISGSTPTWDNLVVRRAA